MAKPASLFLSSLSPPVIHFSTIVYSPADAIRTFCGSEFDVLVIDDFLVERQPGSNVP
jgi:hypothetical protein